MIAPHFVVVSPLGSGTRALADITNALGYTPHGTVSGTADTSQQRPFPGETAPLLQAAYGLQETVSLLRAGRSGHEQELQSAFKEAVNALWRRWWSVLGQPITHASPLDPAVEAGLMRIPGPGLLKLLPGRGCWYVSSLDLDRADGELLRHWAVSGNPRIVYHHRDVRDRITQQVHALTQPSGRVGTLPENLIYQRILTSLPDTDARITYALTDPNFPGMREASASAWLLHHPDVCVLRHDHLAGPANTRKQELSRLLAAIAHPDPTTALASLPPLHHPDRSTYGLMPGIWRKHFTPGHERLLTEHHSHLLASAPA
ncbi:hypothetical protein [Streptomyces atroolivaceus]|uniref:hypothetical protein n=1 Tax=Streptomyces atroolivaceus TaxID=66869 RepID=UPI0036457878